MKDSCPHCPVSCQICIRGPLFHSAVIILAENRWKKWKKNGIKASLIKKPWHYSYSSTCKVLSLKVEKTIKSAVRKTRMKIREYQRQYITANSLEQMSRSTMRASVLDSESGREEEWKGGNDSKQSVNLRTLPFSSFIPKVLGSCMISCKQSRFTSTYKWGVVRKYNILGTHFHNAFFELF